MYVLEYTAEGVKDFSLKVMWQLINFQSSVSLNSRTKNRGHLPRKLNTNQDL